MIASASVMALSVNIGPSVADSPTARPAKMLSITSTKPSAEHSSTLPGRQ
jgi:hypothetical protein